MVGFTLSNDGTLIVSLNNQHNQSECNSCVIRKAYFERSLPPHLKSAKMIVFDMKKITNCCIGTRQIVKMIKGFCDDFGLKPTVMNAPEQLLTDLLAA